MSDRFFLDTNILVYARDSRFPEKQSIADKLVQNAFASGLGRVSRQVLHEFYVTTTRKLSPGLDKKEAREAVTALEYLETAPRTGAALKYAWSLEDRFQLSFWDSLIIAAASLEECSVIYTEDLRPGLQVDKLRIVNPFTAK